jgi:hypothetical protein
MPTVLRRDKQLSSWLSGHELVLHCRPWFASDPARSDLR